MLNLRDATPKDIPLILSLIRELAEYEREPHAVHCSENDLLRDGFGPNPIIHVIIAEWDASVVGMALYYHYYSTWEGRRGIFLEDLFVRPGFRGKGIGRALMTRLAQTALAENCYAMRWEVLDWNWSAIEFYEGFGSEFREGWKVMQVKGESLKQLADGSLGSRTRTE